MIQESIFTEEYESVADEQTKLIDRANALFKDLLSVAEIDRKRPNKKNSELRNIKNDLDSLQSDWVSWNKNAKLFRDAPEIKVPLPDGWETQFLHEVIKIAAEMINVNMAIRNIAESYNLIIERRDAQINFNLARKSYRFAMIALVVSVVLALISLGASVYLSSPVRAIPEIHMPSDF